MHEANPDNGVSSANGTGQDGKTPEAMRVRLSDLFDVAELQQLQDGFSQATGIATLITNADGTPVTVSSGFSRLCQMVRNTEEGAHRCLCSDDELGKPTEAGYRLGPCLSSGLLDAGVAIRVDGVHVGSWLIGQLLEENTKVETLLDYADVVGLDRQAYAEALGKIKRVSIHEFEAMCRFLQQMVASLVDKANKNKQLREEILLRKEAEQKLRTLNEALELHVEERTQQLYAVNTHLEETVAQVEEFNARLEEANSTLEETIMQLEEANHRLNEEIAGRIRLEEELRRAKDEVEDLYQHAPGGYHSLSEDGTFLRINDTELDWLGYSREEILGKMNFGDMLTERSRETFRVNYPIFKQQGWIKDLEFDIHKKNGDILYVLISATVHRDEEGNFLRSRSTVYDITEHKRMEQAREAQQIAEQANLSKSRFLANMSHELRTPMNGIIGMTDIALTTNLTDDQRRYLEVVKTSSRSLLRLLNDLLDYSKIEAGKMNLEKKPLHLRNVVADVTGLFAPIAQKKPIRLTYRVSDDVPDRLIGDEVRLRQVLSNFIGNAVKFTNEGVIQTQVSFEEEKEGKVALRFEVMDTGIGIPKDQQETLFERFTQGEDPRVRKAGGTGLGLAISKNLVQMMGGKIKVESEPDKGSRFSFTVEFETFQDTMQMDSTAPSGIGESRVEPVNARILLVEDDAVGRLLALMLLKKRGYTADVAENGREALDRLEKQAYDLVLMDVNMPVMDGFTATGLIREREKTGLPGKGRRLPILAMTAYALSGDEQKCLQAGMDDYIPKPVDISLLTAKLKKWLG